MFGGYWLWRLDTGDRVIRDMMRTWMLSVLFPFLGWDGGPGQIPVRFVGLGG